MLWQLCRPRAGAGHDGSGLERRDAVTGEPGAAAQRQSAGRTEHVHGQQRLVHARRAGTINVTATDDVGVTKLQYSTDNGATWIDATITPGPSVTAAIAPNAEGNTTVRYRAQDAAGDVARGVAANTTLSAAAAVGATGVRLAEHERPRSR